jgi:cleavage and polyadenylation specificity factor subunit 2
MGRIAVSEDVEGIRDEQDVVDDTQKKDQESDLTDAEPSVVPTKNATNSRGMYVATLQDVHDAFDSVNTLRYSQPTHLQGSSRCRLT